MVKKGILRMLGVFISLMLIISAIPATLALAAVTVYITNDNTESDYFGDAAGTPGDKIIIGGTGTTGVSLDIYLSSQLAALNEEIGDEVTIYKKLVSVTPAPSVNFIADSPGLTVPTKLNDNKNLHGGTYYIYVVISSDTDKNIVASTEFEIKDVSKGEIDVEQGPVGTTVTITGEGYAPEEELVVKFGTTDITDLVENPVTEDDGTFEVVFEVPESVNGNKDITITGDSSNAEVKFTFKVLANITLSVASGEAGTAVTVHGTGFAKSKYVDIFIGTTKLDDDSLAIRTDKTSLVGSFTTTVTVPASLAAGTYTIKAEDETTSTINDTASFTVILSSAITISDNSGNVDDKTTVSGTKFAAGTTVTIFFDSTNVGTTTVEANGNFTKEISVPPSAGGAHKIKVGSLEVTYTVESKMALGKTQGIAGTTITITGTGFAASTAITAKFNNTAVAVNPATTDANGGFISSFVVPTTAAGTYNVEVIAGSTRTASFTIVESSISIDKTSGQVGDAITVTGVNFAAGSTVTMKIDGATVTTTPGTITVGSTGGFTASFNIPAISGGVHTVVAGNGATSDSAEFTVTATASVNPEFGNVGTSITVNGNGFKASAPLTIKYNGVTVGSGSFSGTGSFPGFTFVIPASAGGARTIEISDGTSTVTKTFTMETTPPAAPSLTLPLAASKEKGNITFDWSDVTDASSPVTYTLQVATDSNFTTLVLNIAGLTASTYTMPEGQTLAKLDNNASYYWKVKATDAASNSSSSGTSTFTVGMNLPDWLMWVWIGIGALVIFIFAIWLGKRLAFSRY
jgi:hypothetical protein